MRNDDKAIAALNNIAQKKKTPVADTRRDPEELAGDVAVNTKNRWMQDTQGMEPAKRSARYKTEVLDKVLITDSNNEELHDEWFGLHPMGYNAGRTAYEKETMDTVQSWADKNKIALETGIRNNFTRFYKPLFPEIDRIFKRNSVELMAQQRDWTGITRVLSVEPMMENVDYNNLNTNGSLKGNARVILKMKQNGVEEGHEVDSDGVIVYPTPEGFRPAWDLPEELDLITALYDEIHTLPLIEKKLKPYYDSSIGKRQDEHKVLLKNLYDNRHRLPEDSKDNAVIDYALSTDNPNAVLWEAIYADTLSQIDRALNFKDVTRLWMSSQRKLNDRLSERISGDAERTRQI
jgi:hypothetical protein